MKFNEYKVKKPNEKKIVNKINEYTERLKNSNTKEEAISCINSYFKYMDKVESNFTVISIKHTIDMNDKFISKLSDICDIIGPKLAGPANEFDRAIYESKFKEDLIKKYGKTLFDRIENEFKLYKPEIVEDKIKENQLCNEYQQVIAGAKIEFEGKIYNLSSLAKFLSDSNRDTRLNAADAYYGFLKDKNDVLGRIYDDLVKVRTKIAKTLGFKNAIEYCYKSLGRLDYNEEMVKVYRKQIYEDVVPLAVKLRKRQAQRLEIKKPIFIDYNVNFKSGNATPKGDTNYLVQCASKMYHELSPLTGDFFDKMVEDNLMDLDAKPGKMTGGYMTYIPDLKMPFIFSNSNGTSGDVDTLTHEFGHSFQGYMGSKIKVPSYRMPTLEGAEIDSMSMEFFAWPWMDLFFKEEANKYKYAHLTSAILFLPYGCMVDEFQHWVYENPEVTHEDRCNKWKDISRKYQPDKKFSGYDFAESHLWMRQAHIFESPFYYIDYCLAQVLALEFKYEMDKDQQKAWNKYVKLCKLGGKYHFLTLLDKAHLKNPFKDGMVKKFVKSQVKVLNSFDDKNM